MRPVRPLCILAAVVALGTPGLRAATTLTIADGLDDPSSVQMAPGQIYSVWLVVQTDDPVTTIEGDLGCSAPNVVEVTSIAFAAGWDQLGDLLALPPAGALPTALNTSLHLGSGRTNTDAQTGTFGFATITFQISPSAQPGQYTLTFTNAELSSADFQPLTAEQGPLYVINVSADGGEPDDDAGEGDPGDEPPPAGDEQLPDPDDAGDTGDSPQQSDPPAADGGQPGADTGGGSKNDDPPEELAGGGGGPPPGTIGASAGPAAGCGAGLAQTAMMSAGMLLLIRRRRAWA